MAISEYSTPLKLLPKDHALALVRCTSRMLASVSGHRAPAWSE